MKIKVRPHWRDESEPVAVSHSGGGFIPVSTEVLWRCTCGRLHTQTLRGRWELADVRGETAIGQGPVKLAS